MLAKKMICALLLITAPTLALAYIDPGVMGALFQGMYVAIFGFVTAWVLKPWQYIKSWLHRNKSPEEKTIDMNSTQGSIDDKDLK